MYVRVRYSGSTYIYIYIQPKTVHVFLSVPRRCKPLSRGVDDGGGNERRAKKKPGQTFTLGNN